MAWVKIAWAVVLDPNTSAAFRTKNHFIRLYTDTEDANDGCLKYDIAAWPVTSAIPQLTIVRHCPQDGPIVIPK